MIFNYAAIGDAPEALLRFIDAPPRGGGGTAAARAMAQDVVINPEGKVLEGQRNSALASLAGGLRRKGLGEQALLRALLALNEQLCDPPLPSHEVESIARSIAKYPVTDRAIPVLSVWEMMALPESEWLIDGILPANALVVLCGPPAQYKSFIALDWSLSIAAGTDWQGYRVLQTPVLYVVAEGANGYGRRIAAWLDEHPAANVSGARFVPQSVQLTDGESVDALIESVRALEAKPGLIVVDTLARCFVGGEENSAKEVGVLVDAAERIRAETGASVMLVHHTGKSGDLRGSTSLSGAAYAIIGVKKKTKTSATIRCIKTKDVAEFATIDVAWKSVGASGVLEVSGTSMDTEDEKPVTGNRRKVLDALIDGPLRSKELQIKSGVAEGSFKAVRRGLVEHGLIEAIDRKYHLTERGRHAIEVEDVP